MPLKKPKSVPKIAKARKKTIDKMKETVPVKKEAEREYNCKIAFKFNPLKKSSSIHLHWKQRNFSPA